MLVTTDEEPMLQAELDLDFSTVLVSSSDAQTHGFTCGWHVSGELQVAVQSTILHLRPPAVWSP